MFHVPPHVLARDPTSLLAQLVKPISSNTSLLPDEDGSFYLDRDWWLFRYVVMFLRDGTLPEDRQLLAKVAPHHQHTSNSAAALSRGFVSESKAAPARY